MSSPSRFIPSFSCFWIVSQKLHSLPHSTMRLSLTTAAVAASILSSAGLVAAAPMATSDSLGELEISVLGGTTFRFHQTANANFQPHGRGPRELARAYQKYGAAVPEDLIQIVLEILAELGFSSSGGNGGGADGNGNGNSTAGEGRSNYPSGPAKGSILTSEQERL